MIWLFWREKINNLITQSNVDTLVCIDELVKNICIHSYILSWSDSIGLWNITFQSTGFFLLILQNINTRYISFFISVWKGYLQSRLFRDLLKMFSNPIGFNNEKCIALLRRGQILWLGRKENENDLIVSNINYLCYISLIGYVFIFSDGI